MLKRENRLSKIVRRLGERKFLSPLFSVGIFSNNSGNARFGFVVSKKIDKRAVVRNKTKRVLRAAAAEFLGDLAGKDVVVNAKKALSSEDKKEVIRELSSILNK